MALISCPDCTAEVSDKAPACLKCGHPIASASDIQKTGGQLTTIQETSKRLKAHIAVAVVAMLVGGVWAISQINMPSPNTGPPATIFFIGLLIYVVARVRIWWHHK